MKQLVAGGWETVVDDAPPLWGIWGTGSSDFFVFGGQGTEVRRWSGGTWTTWDLVGLWGHRGDGTIRAIWGAASDDVFVVGREGFVAHFDGATWRAVDALTAADLEAIWGVSGKDVRAVGSGGTILHFDGVNWTPEESPTGASLDGIWGSSASDIFVTGVITPELEHVILHNDGTGWVEQHAGPKTLLGIHGIAHDCVYAVGGIRDGDGVRSGVFFFDGQGWTKKTDSTTMLLWGVWVLPGCTFYAVGPDDTLIHGG